jgi:DNA-binding MarR family transcriptional regulator
LLLPVDLICSQLSVSEQLHSELSQQGQSLSSERLLAWRLYFESALALTDVLDAELERDAGIPLRWYDVLVHLEDFPEGLRMKDLAGRILYSKSGFTRVVDRLEDAGLVQRVRPDNDRRSILVVLTDKGHATIDEARRQHHQAIGQHFSEHLSDADVAALTQALEKVSAHARPLRPGRIRS